VVLLRCSINLPVLVEVFVCVDILPLGLDVLELSLPITIDVTFTI